MKKRIFISSLLATTLVYLASVKLTNKFSAIIICLSFVLSAYYSKYFDYISFKNSNYEVMITCGKFGIPRLKFQKVQVLRKIADSYIWASKVSALAFSMAIGSIGNIVLKTQNERIWVYSIIGAFLGCLFHTNDIKKMFKIWFGKRDSFYVQFLDKDVELIKTEGVMYLHREVYFYEEAFKNYSKDDLKRELILVEQNIHNMNQSRFWDKYLLPIIFIFITTVYGVINSMFIFDISSLNVNVSHLLKQYLISLAIIALIILPIFIVKHFMLTPPKSNMIVKKMILEDLLKNQMS